MSERTHTRLETNASVKGQHNRRRSKDRQHIVDQILEVIRSHAEQTETQTLRTTLKKLQQASRIPQERPEPAAKKDLVRALSEGREYTRSDAVLLEWMAQKRAFDRRQELLRDALTAAQVGKLLGTTRQTPHDRLRRGKLLAIEDKGQWMFPAWQFDPEGPHGVVSGLPEALMALDISALGKASWLTTPNPYLDGRTPLQALKDGDTERVIDQAQAVGAC